MCASATRVSASSPVPASGLSASRCLSARRRLLPQAVSLAMLGAAALPVDAQQLEEVIVTATKRAESVMDVPLSITAMSGNEIRKINLNDVKDLIYFTPGITGNSKDSFLDFVSVRGIRTIDYGNGGDPSISLFKNGLYQGRTGSGVSSLYDVERSEVLRGPQGFLFARNSVAGGMNIITTKASLDEVKGFAEVDVGERGVFVFEGAVNVPLTDRLAMRVAAFHTEEDGYVENIAGGDDLISHDNDSLRVSFRYESERVTGDLILEYDNRNQFGTVYRTTGNGPAFNVAATRINGGVPIAFDPDARTVNNDNSPLEPRDDTEAMSAALLLDIDLGFATLTSLTGYKDHEYDYVEDYDGMPITVFNYGQDQEGTYFEQELRLTSNGDGPLDWYAGVSYYNEEIDTDFLGQQAEDAYCLGYWYATCADLFDYYNNVYYGGAYAYILDYYFGTYQWTPSASGVANDINRIGGKYQGYSAYVDLKYDLTDTLEANIGVRYNYDEKKFSQQGVPDPDGSILNNKVQTGYGTPEGPVSDKQDWDAVTWRAVLNWRPNDDTLLFASVATGYKPGGFDSFTVEGPASACVYIDARCAAIPGVDRPGDYDEESVISYEVGYKGRLMDGRSQLSLTGFFYQYEDLQAIRPDPEAPQRSLVDNAGEVDGWGVEAEFSIALTDYLSARFGGSWFDSEAREIEPFCDVGATLTGSDQACEGNSIPWAPEYTAFAVIDGALPLAGGEAFGVLSWTWEDSIRGDWPGKDIIYQEIPMVNQADLQLGYRKDNWSVLAYVENIMDQNWFDGAYANGDVLPADSPDYVPFLYPEHTFGPARPRTAGVRVSYNF